MILPAVVSTMRIRVLSPLGLQPAQGLAVLAPPRQTQLPLTVGLPMARPLTSVWKNRSTLAIQSTSQLPNPAHSCRCSVWALGLGWPVRRSTSSFPKGNPIVVPESRSSGRLFVFHRPPAIAHRAGPNFTTPPDEATLLLATTPRGHLQDFRSPASRRSRRPGGQFAPLAH